MPFNPTPMDMDIDIEQLPIPDWGLHCQSCGYPLKGLPEHRCPECGTRLDLPALLQTWMRLREPQFTGGELPFPDFGLSCAECDEPLAGVSEHRCPSCRTPFDAQALIPPGEWCTIPPSLPGDIPARTLEMLLAEEYIPYVKRVLRDVSHIYGIDPHAEIRFEIPADFYFDFLLALRREQLRAQQQAGHPDWQCEQCGESNPGSFQICWNCRQVVENQ